MAKKNDNYDQQAIRALTGPDRVRKKPSVIFGSDGIEGCEHAFFEILSNSIDESREGYGNKIIVTAFNDHSLQVEDFGRGVPMDYNDKEKRYNWELVFCELYAGGKYDNNNEGAAYGFSLGTNGLGACATQYSSEYMEVVSCNGGNRYSIRFERGFPKTKLAVEPCSKSKTGTTIRWLPDIQVFNDIKIQKSFFEETLKRQTVANEGLRIVLRWQNADGNFDESEFYYENGISDYIKEIAEGVAISPVERFSTERVGRDRPDKPEYTVKMTAAFCFSDKISMTEYYHNSSFLEHGGAPEKAVKAAFTWAVDNYLTNNNKYQRNEPHIGFSDIDESLVLVISSFSTVASYENQTKKAITNKFIQDAMTDWLKNMLTTYFVENPEQADKICMLAYNNKTSRESAAAAKKAAKSKPAASLQLDNSVEKFVNCREKNPDICEIYIVEGDSALTSCKLARDPNFQALLPVRGKTINCIKAKYEALHANDIVRDMIKVLGCGVEKDAKNRTLPTFSLDRLRWNKIIICTDADVDGYQIRTLLLTLFYRLMPSLITAGKIFIAETPLYEIRTKEKTMFAYDDAEKNRIVSELGDKKYMIMRSKGLGENEPEMMSLTTMHPATRRLIKITAEPEGPTKAMFDLMLGDDIEGRKRHIALYGLNYLEEMDV